MKVFISWSGSRSRAVAELLSDWIKCVLQATNPWISTRDIDRGARWFSEISDQLKDTTVGIVCLTHENISRPWILFEAGALAKGLPSNRVCTFLVDLESSDLEGPLAQFNYTLPSREGLLGLMNTLNISLGASALEKRILEQVFETYWPQFESDFELCLNDNPQDEKVEPRSDKDILKEILENTRSLGRKVRALESRIDLDGATLDGKSGTEIFSHMPAFLSGSTIADSRRAWTSEADVSDGVVRAAVMKVLAKKHSNSSPDHDGTT